MGVDLPPGVSLQPEGSGTCQIRLGLLSWRNFSPEDAKVRGLSLGPKALTLQPWVTELEEPVYRESIG